MLIYLFYFFIINSFPFFGYTCWLAPAKQTILFNSNDVKLLLFLTMIKMLLAFIISMIAFEYIYTHIFYTYVHISKRQYLCFRGLKIKFLLTKNSYWLLSNPSQHYVYDQNKLYPVIITHGTFSFLELTLIKWYYLIITSFLTFKQNS